MSEAKEVNEVKEVKEKAPDAYSFLHSFQRL
jgi:hypothetical protein